MSRFWRLMLFVTATCCFSACGKKEEAKEDVKPQQAQVVQRRSRPAAVPAAGEKVGLAARKSPTAKEEPPANTKENAIDPATDPEDIFVIGGSAFEFDVAGQAPEHRVADLFAVTVPKSGDFERYDVVVPRRDAPASPSPARKIALPAGFSAVLSEGIADSGLPWRIRCEKDQSIMALIPAGTSPIGKDGGPDESSPQLTVYLDNFYIDITEVTLTQYELFRKAIKDEKGRTMREPQNAASPPDHPALGIPWTEVGFYANWSGKELPNEAEWEKSARGEKGFDYPWGGGRAVWSRSRTVDQIDAVKSFRTDRSTYGVYDLAGNAREWCIDYYSPKTYSDAAAAGAVVRDWKGPRRNAGEKLRVVRGGGPNWEAWHRTGLNMQEQQPLVGFRCVLRLESAEAARRPTKKGPTKK